MDQLTIQSKILTKLLANIIQKKMKVENLNLEIESISVNVDSNFRLNVDMKGSVSLIGVKKMIEENI